MYVLFALFSVLPVFPSKETLHSGDLGGEGEMDYIPAVGSIRLENSDPLLRTER